jgi:uncharacterized membrane protein YdbT with pleckstrin-like domain
MRELLVGENLVRRYRRHWVLLFRRLVVAIILLGLVITLVVMTRNVASSDVRLVLLLAGFGLLGVWAIVAWVRWTADALTLTDQRVILETGIFNRVTKVIALDRVTDVGTRQSLLGSMLGYGTVEIHTASLGGAELFSSVPYPDQVRDEVFVQAGHLRPRPPVV